ncbi:MAG: DNRLRE domain-containing protein [Calditrichia bacterium]
MRISFKYSLFLMFMLVFTVSTGSSTAQQIVTLDAVKDNTLYEDANGGLSNGAGQHFFAGKTAGGEVRRGLVKFDVAGNIPAASTIDSVFLVLNLSRTISAAHTVSLHRLLNDWGEGTSDAPGQQGGGTAATVNDATWIYTFYNTDFWTTAGGDFSATASASLPVNSPGVYTWASTPQMVADVQDWLNNPSANFGWALLGNESADGTAKRFDSRENPTAANRPALMVYYSPATAIRENDQQLPEDYRLAQNYPNPFNPTTRIEFSVREAGVVSLTVFDNIGRRVAVPVQGHLSAGNYTVHFNAEHLSSGIYYYSLHAGNHTLTRKMLLLR